MNNIAREWIFNARATLWNKNATFKGTVDSDAAAGPNLSSPIALRLVLDGGTAGRRGSW